MSEPSPASSVVSIEQSSPAVVVHVLAPELRKSEVDALCGEVDKAQAAAPRSLPFILDMSSVRFAGSLAMGVLVGLSQEFRTRGQRLIFVGFQSNVHDAINMLRMNRIIEIMPDVPTAVQSVAG
jgi:anti-anti-sigma factor